MKSTASQILDLWKKGYSASYIAGKLYLSGIAAVAQTVKIAREAGDKRAVYHRRGGWVCGDFAPEQHKNQRWLNGFSIVNVRNRPRKAFCKRGHLRSPENVQPSNGTCRLCRRRPK